MNNSDDYVDYADKTHQEAREVVAVENSLGHGEVNDADDESQKQRDDAQSLACLGVEEAEHSTDDSEDSDDDDQDADESDSGGTAIRTHNHSMGLVGRCATVDTQNRDVRGRLLAGTHEV